MTYRKLHIYAAMWCANRNTMQQPNEHCCGDLDVRHKLGQTYSLGKTYSSMTTQCSKKVAAAAVAAAL